MSDFRTYITQTGFGLERDAKLNNTHVPFANLIVGDGKLNDADSPAVQTGLINKVKSYPVTIVKDDVDPSVWVARAEIPASEGGFSIFEAGLETSDGHLYCYARQPGDYKPLLSEGLGKSYTIRLKFVPSNADTIEIKIDPSVQFATPNDLNLVKAGLESYSDEATGVLSAELDDVILSAGLAPESGVGRFLAALNKAFLRVGSFGVGGAGIGVENGNQVNKAGFYSGNGAQSNNFPSDRSRFSGYLSVPYLNDVKKVSNLHFDDEGRVFHRYTSGSDVWNESELYGTKNLDMCGSIWSFSTLVTPAGFLKANGAAVSRELYKDLFNKIGTTYGDGDGSTTFNLPDVRADFPRFLDEGRGVDVGRLMGSFQDHQTAEHGHPTDGTGGGSRHVIDMNGDGTFDAYSTRVSGDDGGYAAGSNTGKFGGDETRGRNTAFAGYVKY